MMPEFDLVAGSLFIKERRQRWRILGVKLHRRRLIGRLACQIASNSDPLFASNRDPSSGAGKAYRRHT
jgi:hypothetical protein